MVAVGISLTKSLHERTTVKSVEDHRALGISVRVRVRLRVRNQSPWWQWVFLSEKPP